MEERVSEYGRGRGSVREGERKWLKVFTSLKVGSPSSHPNKNTRTLSLSNISLSLLLAHKISLSLSLSLDQTNPKHTALYHTHTHWIYVSHTVSFSQKLSHTHYVSQYFFSVTHALTQAHTHTHTNTYTDDT